MPDNLGSAIRRYNGTTGDFIDNFVPAGSGGLNSPEAATFGPDGNLYVTGRVNGDVRKYNGVTGAPMGVFSSGGSLVRPVALAFGPDGNLYVADEVNVLKFNGSTGAFVTTFVSGGTTHPLEVVFGADGILYVGAEFSVLRYNATTGAFIGEFFPQIGIRSDGGLAFGPDLSCLVVSESTLPALTGDPKRTVAGCGRCRCHVIRAPVILRGGTVAGVASDSGGSSRSSGPWYASEPSDCSVRSRPAWAVPEPPATEAAKGLHRAGRGGTRRRGRDRRGHRHGGPARREHELYWLRADGKLGRAGCRTDHQRVPGGVADR